MMPEKHLGRKRRAPDKRTLYLGLFNTIMAFLFLAITSTSCSEYFKDDYKDNSPTSGRLKVYYDEGLQLHVKNQAFTFESQYPHASLDLVCTSENRAVQALYDDSCEALVLSRLLTDNEKKAFESKQFFPKYSAVAKSGVAIITNQGTGIQSMSLEEIKQLLTTNNPINDSSGHELKIKALLDKNNSAVVHYLLDSLLHAKTFGPRCNVLGSSPDAINYVAGHPNSIAFIDYAWLSDSDDSITLANKDKIKFIGIKTGEGKSVEFPSQSSFKLGTYPFTRTVYVMRKTGDFSLAKGFESFVAGPKGQLTFLKQGLLPSRQAERQIEVKFEPLQTQ